MRKRKAIGVRELAQLAKNAAVAWAEDGAASMGVAFVLLVALLVSAFISALEGLWRPMAGGGPEIML
jgi:hypothetical protein